MSKTLKYILAILATILATFVGSLLAQILPPIGMGIMLICTLLLMGLPIALVIHLMKLIVAHVARDFPRRTPVQAPYSWGQVAAAFAIMPPLGLFYMIHKTCQERQILRLNGVKLVVIGSTVLLLTFPLILSILLARADAIILLVPGMYAVCSVVPIALGLRLLHQGKINDLFLDLILDEKTTRIDQLATHTSMTYAKVTKKVQWLIDNDLLSGAYIYHQDKEIIVPGISSRIAIKCKNCAGTSVLYANDARVCVYCGGPI